MQLKMVHYVAVSGKKEATIAKEIGVSRQVIKNWLRRNTPVLVTIDPGKLEIIEKVTIEKVVFQRFHEEKDK